MAKLTDNSLMPFGKFKGQAMVNVPAWNLIWLHEGNAFNDDDLRRFYPEVFEYIADNVDAIYKEKKKEDEIKKYNNRYNSM
jgi:uncharacterized protein (DUF3820 family)